MSVLIETAHEQKSKRKKKGERKTWGFSNSLSRISQWGGGEPIRLLSDYWKGVHHLIRSKSLDERDTRDFLVISTSY